MRALQPIEEGGKKVEGEEVVGFDLNSRFFSPGSIRDSRYSRGFFLSFSDSARFLIRISSFHLTYYGLDHPRNSSFPSGPKRIDSILRRKE